MLGLETEEPLCSFCVLETENKSFFNSIKFTMLLIYLKEIVLRVLLLPPAAYQNVFLLCFSATDPRRFATREMHETVGRPEMEDMDDLTANTTATMKRGLKMIRSVSIPLIICNILNDF